MRSFTAADQTQVRDLVLSGLRERWDATFDPDANPDLDDISSFYVDRGADVVVIEVDDVRSTSRAGSCRWAKTKPTRTSPCRPSADLVTRGYFRTSGGH